MRFCNSRKFSYWNCVIIKDWRGVLLILLYLIYNKLINSLNKLIENVKVCGEK